MDQKTHMNTPLTIIVPAKQEQKTVIPTLESLRKYVHTPHRIIVVNVSNTTDRTADIVKRYIKTHPRIQLIQKIHPHGTFGMALLHGFQAVTHGAVVPFMADACDNPKDIDLMYAKLLGGWDIVVASRYMKNGKKIGGPAVQSFFSKLVGRSLHLFTGVPTSDISNAFKMYRKSIIKNTGITPDSGVEASMALTLRAYFSGARVTEIPTIWTGRTVGQSKFKLVQRAPQYIRIYLWALYNTIRRIVSL